MLPNGFTLIVYAPEIDASGEELLKNSFEEDVYILDENDEAIQLIKRVRDERRYPIVFVYDDISDYGISFVEYILDNSEGDHNGILWLRALNSEEQVVKWSSHIKNFKGWYIPEGGFDIRDIPEVCRKFLEGDPEIDKIS